MVTLGRNNFAYTPEDGSFNILVTFLTTTALELDEGYYEAVVRPIMYNYIKDADIFRRNAAIALGNSGDPAHLPALRRALDATDREPVRKAIAWAIRRLEQTKQSEARGALA